MRAEEDSGLLWQESMSVGFPELDEQRKYVLELLKLLEIRPLYSIASETFISRFNVVQAALDNFIKYEERLLSESSVPEERKRQHLLEHARIRTILRHIHSDSINKKNQTALDVYKTLRNEIENHVFNFGSEISDYILPLTHAENVKQGTTQRELRATRYQ